MMNTTELLGECIDNLNKIYDALNETPDHPYLCRTYHQKIGQVSVLTQDMYNHAKQQDKFWNKTYSKMSLIEVASFVNQCVYKDLETSDVDLNNLFKNKEKLVKLFKNCREKTNKKIQSMSGLSKVMYKILYWFFDPINKINDLNNLSEETCKNYHFSYHVGLAMHECESAGIAEVRENWTLQQLETWLNNNQLNQDQLTNNDKLLIIKCNHLLERWKTALKKC